MEKIRTKEAAEAALRELPSVIGAFVREDIYGHPREVHLLIRPGPNVRHLAHDVRDMLEERLQVPIDQRIISIAQVVRDPAESPIEDVPEVTAEPEAAATVPEADPAERSGRVVFAGVEAMTRDGRVVVRIRVRLGAEEFVGEATELDVGMGRVRAGANAALHAASAATGNTLRLELDGASVVRAFERDYVLVAVLAAAAELGRRPLALSGAHTGEPDNAATAALAALKAVNRVVGYRLRALASPPAA